MTEARFLLLLLLLLPSTAAATRGPLWHMLVAQDWRDRPGLSVKPRSKAPDPSALVSTARDYLGVPYTWGGVDSGGFDCSGFTNKVYAQHGYDLPRTSREQFKVGQSVNLSHLQTGDLLFFAEPEQRSHITHVAMYVGDGEFIHAARGKGEVTFDRLGTRYYANRVVGARRFISLPPGRYSNAWGGALTGSSSVAGAFDGEALPPEVIAALLQEEPAPPRAAADYGEATPVVGRFDKGAITHVGPDLLHPETTSIGIRTGMGRMHETASFLVAPEVTYFNHGNATRVLFSVPFQIPLNAPEQTGQVWRQSWQNMADYAKVVREISIGQKESRFYLDIGRTNSGSLGHGQLMRYYTPNVASRYLPHYGLRADALSLSLDGSVSWGGFESFIDDVFKPQVVGALAYFKPARHSNNRIGKSFSLGTSYVTDIEQGVHGIGSSAEIKLYRDSTMDLKTYVDVSTLLHEQDTGVGGAFGFLMRANGKGQRHVLRWRTETRVSSDKFLPSYFDATYRLQRLQKLSVLQALNDTGARVSFYNELSYRYLRRFALGLAYEDGSWPGSVTPDLQHNLMFFMQLRNLYIPGTRKAISGYVAYHLRGFNDLGADLGLSKANAYLFASATLALNRHLEVGGTLRKTFDPIDTAGTTVDGVIDIRLNYEL